MSPHNPLWFKSGDAPFGDDTTSAVGRNFRSNVGSEAAGRAWCGFMAQPRPWVALAGRAIGCKPCGASAFLELDNRGATLLACRARLQPVACRSGGIAVTFSALDVTAASPILLKERFIFLDRQASRQMDDISAPQLQAGPMGASRGLFPARCGLPKRQAWQARWQVLLWLPASQLCGLVHAVRACIAVRAARPLSWAWFDCPKIQNLTPYRCPWS